MLERMRQVDHVGGLGGDVAGAGHSDADGGGGQRRRVVDAVADHGHGAALRVELPDAIQLLLGQQLGFDVGMPISRAMASAAPAVAGEHHLVGDAHVRELVNACLTPSRMRSRSRMAPAKRSPSATSTAVAPYGRLPPAGAPYR